jgi:MFS family permease
MIGYIEAATGFGLIIGPIIGSTAYAYLGFAGAFCFYGSLICILSAASFFFHDNKTKETLGNQRPLLSEEPYSPLFKPSQNNELSLVRLLMIPRFILPCVAAGLCYFAYSSMEPILARRLTDFNLTQMEIGMFFAICPVFYITGSLLVQLIPKQVERRLTIVVFSLLNFICFLFVGPS